MKIAALTGKRGGYEAMRPLLKLLRDDPVFQLNLITCDMHSNPEFGNTIDIIKQDFTVFSIDSPLKDQSRGHYLGFTSGFLYDWFVTSKTEILLLYGDRGETLAAAAAAVSKGLPIIHLQGGDNTGTQDDVVRDAITKLSNVHFCSTLDAKKNIIMMGESSTRIFMVGDSHIDQIWAGDFLSPIETRKALSLSDEAPNIVLYHPNLTDGEKPFETMTTILGALVDKGQTIVIYPCSDLGYQDVVRAIEQWPGSSHGAAHKNIERDCFLGLMNISKMLIGNSSAGIIESAYLALPTVNVGNRQRGRLHSTNVFHCDTNTASIRAAYELALAHKLDKYPLLYGTGGAGSKVYTTLKWIINKTDLLKPKRKMNNENSGYTSNSRLRLDS